VSKEKRIGFLKGCPMKRNKMNIRNFIYVNGSEMEQHCFYSCGIEFHEFMSSVSNRPENLLLLKHNFGNARWNSIAKFDYVTSQEIKELINDDVYSYGDFCWVDFNKEEDLDLMSAMQIAELLFFAHLAGPLQDIPKVRFAYFAHDDGWFNKLYVTKLEDYEQILSKAIIVKLQQLTKRSVVDIPRDISKMLMEFTRAGLFIDLSQLSVSKTTIKIPITTIGTYTDMDKVCGLKNEIMDYSVRLEYSEKKWKLIREG
jgi:hypothetical protein